ncbi:Uncharacterized protein HZ326_22825 [Fusarium oxysporum f. sp. albedinis]|nr:Uncharacterized protein HZ326_22825 [Fusarium oxysporum f. sp. albedinis]
MMTFDPRRLGGWSVCLVGKRPVTFNPGVQVDAHQVKSNPKQLFESYITRAERDRHAGLANLLTMTSSSEDIKYRQKVSSGHSHTIYYIIWRLKMAPASSGQNKNSVVQVHCWTDVPFYVTLPWGYPGPTNWNP